MFNDFAPDQVGSLGLVVPTLLFFLQIMFDFRLHVLWIAEDDLVLKLFPAFLHETKECIPVLNRDGSFPLFQNLFEFGTWPKELLDDVAECASGSTGVRIPYLRAIAAGMSIMMLNCHI